MEREALGAGGSWAEAECERSLVARDGAWCHDEATTCVFVHGGNGVVAHAGGLDECQQRVLDAEGGGMERRGRILEGGVGGAQCT